MIVPVGMSRLADGMKNRVQTSTDKAIGRDRFHPQNPVATSPATKANPARTRGSANERATEMASNE